MFYMHNICKREAGSSGTRNFYFKILKTLIFLSLTGNILMSILCNHEASYNGGCSRMVSDFLQIFLCGVF